MEYLVTTRSEDGFRLDGVVVRPEDGGHSLVVIWIPGLYATFYDPSFPQLARELARLGYASVVGNTRGHDFGAALRRDLLHCDPVDVKVTDLIRLT